MATVATNVLVDGLRGKFGNSIVFRTMRGKTHVSPPSRKPDKKKESTAQRSTRAKFSEAAQWAQTILLDPEKKIYYKQRAKALKLPNAYTAAITDYMRKPTVTKIQQAGSTIYRINKPGFKLKQVLVVSSEGSGAPQQDIVTHQHKDEWFIRQVYDGKSSPFPVSLIIHDNTLHEIKFVDTHI